MISGPCSASPEAVNSGIDAQETSVGSGRVLRIEQPVVRVVEPFRSADRAEVVYRLASSAGLGRWVVGRLRGASLHLNVDGRLLVRPPSSVSSESLPGRWWRAGNTVCFTAAFQFAAGVWETFDGLIEHCDGDEFLDAMYVDGFRATIAHVHSRLTVLGGREAAEVSWPVVAEGIDEGLPNAEPATALDVDFPLYDLTFFPADGFPGATEHQSRLQFIGTDPDRFTMSLVCIDDIGDGSVSWSREDFSRERDLTGSRISAQRQRTKPGTLPRWFLNGQPIALDEAKLIVDFDPENHCVSGALQATTAAGNIMRGTFQGVLRGREVQRLRERLARPDIVGEWSAAIGSIEDQTFVDAQVMHHVGPPCVKIDSRDTLDTVVRLVPALDLAVGLRGHPAAGVEFVALQRRQPRVPPPQFVSDDRQALRYLAQDLINAGRPAEARPLLERASALIEQTVATAREGLRDADPELISLVHLLNHQVRCVFQVRDYPALVAHLRQAVALRQRLSSTRHVQDLVAVMQDTLADVRGVLDRVAEQVSALACLPQVKSDRSAPSFAVLAGLLRSAVRAVAEVHTAAATLAAEPVLDDENAAAEALVALDHTLVDAGITLRDLVPRCLADGDALFGGVPEEIRERDLIVAQVNGGAGLDDAALAELMVREQRLTDTVRGNTTLSPPLAELLLAQKDAATTILMTANQLDNSRNYLTRADPLTSLAQRRQGNVQAASELSVYIEQWRGLLDHDWDRILAVEEALGFYDQLVGMLLDLGVVDQALVASEMARARATADLLAAHADSDSAQGTVVIAPALDVTRLRAIVVELGHCVVEYFMRADELVIWVIDPREGVICVRQPGSAAHLSDVVERLHQLTELRSTSGNPEIQDIFRWLGAHLWDPLAGTLPDDPDLPISVVPHGPLFRVPFAGLTDVAGQPLLTRHTLVLVPALALLPDLLARQQPNARDGSLLALVNPEPMPLPTLGTLAWTQAHFHRVADLYPADAREVRIGPEATLDHLQRPDQPPAVILLATHAEASDGDQPGAESFVALARTDRHHGLLRARDVRGLELTGTLVILSACYTGGGRITGDGVVGLSRAFLVEGATSLVLTLHKVVEEVSFELVYQFLTQWKNGCAVGIAFRRAQLVVAEEFPDDPALWAPFALYGLGR